MTRLAGGPGLPAPATGRATLRLPGLLLVVGALPLIASAGALAQQPEARVVVRVEHEGGPVAGARVTSGRLATLTDASGEAVLLLPPGPATLRVERIGFRVTDVPVDAPTAGTIEVRVTLEAEALEAEGIVVTSTRSDRRIEDEPLRVEVIDREEVEEKLLMTPGDIAMLLNETAGLRVQATAPSLGGASVRVQGLRGRYTLILSDGLPLYGGQSGALGPLQIPPMDLARVEVIKGVASALYGATALGGVVNLISRPPEPERELLLNQTTLGGSDAVLWAADRPADAWGYTLLAGLHRQARADVDDDGWADLPGFLRAVARPRISWSDGAGRFLLATLGGTVENREGGTMEGAVAPIGAPFVEELSTRRIDAGVVARALVDQRVLAFRTSAALQAHAHGFGDVREDDRHLTLFAEGSVAGTLGPHTWVVGAALQRDVYRSLTLPAFDYVHTVPGLFLQDEVDLGEALVVSASARLDRHGVYGTFLNPRLSALLRPGPLALRASAGTGYFAPTPFTEEVEAVGLTRLAGPPTALVAERARSASLDLGVERGGLELNVTVFGSSIENALVTRVEGERLTLENADAPVRAWGTELLARYEAEPLHLIATYTHTRSTEGHGAARREVPLTPRHAAGFVAAWEDEDRARVGMELYYTGPQVLEQNPYRSRSRSYLVLGFLAERRFGRARLFLNAENLLDARQTRWDRLVRPDRSADGRWITDVWAPLEGRVLNGGMRWRF